MTDTSKRAVHLGYAAAAIGLLALALGWLLAKAANGTAMVPAYLAAGVVALLGVLAAARAAFARRQVLEQEQVAEYRRSHATTELFEDADEAVRLATRANEQFSKYFVPVFTIVLGLAVIVSGILLWRAWGQQPAFPVARRPLAMATLSMILGLFPAICGSYFIGVSREPGCRWLRPPGAWMFLVGGLFVLSGGVMLCEHFQKWVLVVDHRCAQVATALLVALGVEFVLSFVIEFYRPRMPGESERPLPESRILALFTEPGGVARNVATSLDYQFGFQVSEVWFYRFLERTVVPLAVCMLLLLWLLTCVVTVNPHESGIRERFGRVLVDSGGAVRALPPGLYLKLPWPFSRIHVFPVEQLQQVIVGSAAGAARKPGAEADVAPEEDSRGNAAAATKDALKDKGLHGEVILWSGGTHGDALLFSVANAPSPDEAKQGSGAALTVSVLTAEIPVYFRVNNLYDFAYRHADARGELRALATREVVHFMAQVDFNRILGPGRAAGAEVLQQRIQASADAHQLGIRIAFVGLQTLHPPSEVGAAFNEVVGASEEMHQRILESEAYAARRKPEAEGQQIALVSAAEGYRQERGAVAQAESERFLKQVLAYRACPSMFVLNSYLEVLEAEGAAIRKYIVATTRGSEVFILDLQEKLRPDLLDLDVEKTGKRE
jgi:regulator of protease activity HflC (stomatin/prohibitin superfamily)